jgi:hypothetical protein
MSNTTDTPPPLAAPSGSGLTEQQNALDWKRFAHVFQSREGYLPNSRDARVQELYIYFSLGAHEEFMGRLTIPNYAWNCPEHLIPIQKVET